MNDLARLPLLLALLALPWLSACSDGAAPGAPSAARGRGLVIRNPGSPDRDYFYDFGTVASGEVVRRVWELENTDPVPVTIRDLSASCSCTKPTISFVHESGELVKGRLVERPVITLPPGAIARLELEIDTQHVQVKNVDKLAMVVLRCDSLNTPYLRFEAHLIARQAYQATPTLVDLGDVPISAGGRAHSDLIVGVRGELSRILGVHSKSDGLEVTIDESQQVSERLWSVTVTLAPPLELGLWEGEVLLRTTEADGTGEAAPFKLPVRAFVVPDVVVLPRALSFGGFDSEVGPRAEGELRALIPGQRVRVVDALLQGALPDGLRADFAPIDPDAEGRSARWRVTVLAPASLEQEFFSGTLQLTLDDPGAAPITVGFVFRRPA